MLWHVYVASRERLRGLHQNRVLALYSGSSGDGCFLCYLLTSIVNYISGTYQALCGACRWDEMSVVKGLCLIGEVYECP